MLLLLYSELCHTFCRFIPLKISAVSWVQSSPPFLTSTKIHRLYPFHLCKHTFPSPLLPFFAFLVYFSKLRMCEPLPNASNSNSFLTSLSRFVFFSLTHTSSSVSLREKLLLCPRCSFSTYQHCFQCIQVLCTLVYHIKPQLFPEHVMELFMFPCLHAIVSSS